MVHIRTAVLITALAAGIIMAATSTPSAQAAAGDLDTSFGSGGLVRQDIFGGVNDDANAMAIQSNGKIVVAGSWHNFNNVTDFSRRTFAVARFNSDGTLDTSFGLGGWTVTHWPNGGAIADAVAVQGDGKIVAAGWYDDHRQQVGPTFALARYDQNGRLDTSFSGDGKLRTSFEGWDVAHAVAVRDGKIIVAGHSDNGEDFALARYTSNGSLDGTFSGDGKVTTGFGGDERAHALVITPLGKIIAAGEKWECDCGIFGSGADLDFALARYNTDGSLDHDFDHDGKVVTGFGEYESANAVVMQPNGWIVAAGRKEDHFALARYDPDGGLDEHFDHDGKVVTDVFGGFASAEAVAIQSDGKIVAAGSSYEYEPSKYDFVLTRYLRSGELDTSFSGDGQVRRGLSGRYDNARAVAIQNDGKIVAAGTMGWLVDGGDLGLARFEAE